VRYPRPWGSLWGSMTMTGIETRARRRQFLRWAGFLSAQAVLLPQLSACQTARRNWCFSACDAPSGQHFVAAWPQGAPEEGFKIAVPLRAHAPAVHPFRNEALFFSRRPGTEIYVINCASKQLTRTLKAKQGHHFYGHGCFSRDGKHLFTTENPYYLSSHKGSEGLIGIYDTQNYQRVGEIACGGIGPHQVQLMPDQSTLVVANGGIFTHPSRPREKLNVDTMQSSLCYLDANSGAIIDRYYPEHAQMSLRHLDCSPQGHVVVGGQFQGPAHETHPLVLQHRGEDTLQALHTTRATWQSQSQYIASVVVDSNGRTAMTTAPRGGVVDLWDLEQGTHKQNIRIKDAAGASFDQAGQRFIISSGRGRIIAWQDKSPPYPLNQDSVKWDNHLLSQTLAV